MGPRGGAAAVGLGCGPLAAPGRREMVPTPVAVIDLADALPVLPQPMQLSTKNDLGRRTTDHPIRSKHGLVVVTVDPSVLLRLPGSSGRRTLRRQVRVRPKAHSDAGSAVGCRVDDPTLAQERLRLVASFAATRVASDCGAPRCAPSKSLRLSTDCRQVVTRHGRHRSACEGRDRGGILVNNDGVAAYAFCSLVGRKPAAQSHLVAADRAAVKPATARPQ